MRLNMSWKNGTVGRKNITAAVKNTIKNIAVTQPWRRSDIDILQILLVELTLEDFPLALDHAGVEGVARHGRPPT
jgi:hypothetical protein